MSETVPKPDTDVIIGVDTHKLTHTAVAVSALGVRLDAVLAVLQARVMVFNSFSRSHGRPRTNASNCARVSESERGAVEVAATHAKRPALSRRAAHQTPKPSCTSSLTRVPRALAKR